MPVNPDVPLAAYSTLDEVRRVLTNLTRRFQATAHTMDGNIQSANLSALLPAPRLELAADEGTTILRKEGRIAAQEVHQKLAKDKLVGSNFDSLKSLYAQREDIKHIVLQLRHGFGASGRKLLKEAEALEDEILAKINTALATNKAIGKKHFPADFEGICRRVSNAIEKQLSGRFTPPRINRRVIAPLDLGTYFCYYFRFDKLKSDKNFVYEHYWIVICEILAPEGAAKKHYINLVDRSDTNSRVMYVATLPNNFVMPGPHLQFDIWATTEKELIAKISNLLAADNFVNVIDPMYFPLDERDIHFTNPLVASWRLKDNILTIKLKGRPSDKTLNDAALDLKNELYHMINTARYHDPDRPREKRFLPTIRHSIVRGEIHLLITLPPRFRGVNVRPSDAKILEQHYGLSKQEIHGLQRRLLG